MTITFTAEPTATLKRFSPKPLNTETFYNESLRLTLNESGTYEWNLKNLGNIRSIKATGSVAGNGTAKIYIEKGGKKYLIYKNK